MVENFHGAVARRQAAVPQPHGRRKYGDHSTMFTGERETSAVKLLEKSLTGRRYSAILFHGCDSHRIIFRREEGK
jgi:hypothetical protein